MDGGQFEEAAGVVMGPEGEPKSDGLLGIVHNGCVVGGYCVCV